MPVQDGYGSADVTTSSALVVRHNTNRRWLFIQNNTDTDIWINLDVNAELQKGIKVEKQGGWHSFDFLQNPFFGNLFAIHGGTGTKTLNIIEATAGGLS